MGSGFDKLGLAAKPSGLDRVLAPKRSGLDRLFSPTGTDETNAEDLTEAAEEAGPVFGRENVRAVKSATRQLPPSRFADIEKKKAESIRLGAEDVKGNVKNVLKAGGNKQAGRTVRSLITDQKQPEKWYSPMVKALDTLDEYTTEFTRTGEAKVLGLPKGVEDNSWEFHDAVRSAAGQGNTGANALETGKAAGVLAAAHPLLAPIGAIIENIPGKQKFVDSLVGEGAGKALKTSWEGMKDLGHEIVADPTTYLTGGGSGLKNLAKLSKLAPDAARGAQALKRAERIMQLGDRPDLVTKAMRLGGVPEAAIVKELGGASQHVGRGGLSIGIGKAQLPLIPDGAISKAVDKVGQALGQGRTNRLPMQALTDRRLTRQMERTARATKLNANEEYLQSAAKVAEAAGKIGKDRTTEILREVIHPPVFSPSKRMVLTAEETAVADEVKRHFGAHEAELRKMGVPLAHNPKSKLYYPLNVGHAEKANKSIWDVLIGSTEAQRGASHSLHAMLDGKALGTAKHGGAAPNLTPRQTDLGLGDLAKDFTDAAGKVHPAHIPDLAFDLASHAKQLSTAKGYHQLQGDLAKRFTDPVTKEIAPHAKRVLNSAFPQMQQALKRQAALVKSGGQETVAMKAGEAALSVFDFIQSSWKKNILARIPAYHAVNIWGDAGLMHGAGVNLPTELAALPAARKGATPLDQMVNAELKPMGIVSDAKMQRLDIPGRSQLAKDTNRLRLLDKTASNTVKVGAKLDKLGTTLSGHGKLPLSSDFGDWWSNLSREMSYRHARRSGMNPQAAQDFVNKVHIDYGSPGTNEWTKRVIPFWNYMSKAPGAVAEGIARKPGRFSQPDKLVRSFHEEQSSESPSYMQERGRTLGAPDIVKQGMSNLNKLMGGEDVVGGLHIAPRMGSYEALGLPMQAYETMRQAAGGSLQGAWRPLAQNLGPWPKFAVEAATDTSLLTGADKGGTSDFAREVLVPSFIPRGIGEATNVGFSLAFPEAENRPYGMPRDVHSILGNENAKSLVGALIGTRPTQTGPSTAFYNQAQEPNVRAFKESAERMAKVAKDRKERAKRDRKHSGK